MLAASRRARRGREQIGLHPLHLLEHAGREAFHRDRLLLAAGPAGEHHGARRHVARADLEPQRHAAALPLVVLGAGLHPVAAVEVDPDAFGGQVALDRVGRVEHAGALVVGPVDRDDHDLVLRQPRRADQALVVAVRHDEGADQARRDAPGRVPDVIELAGCGLERDLERPREVLAEVVARAGLQRLVVLHHRLAAVRADARRRTARCRSSGRSRPASPSTPP